MTPHAKSKGGGNIKYLFVLLLVLGAVSYDMRTYRIPNTLTGMGCITGCLYSVINYGIKGLGYSLVWMIIPVAAMYVMFMIRIIGAGDIKLLAAVGSFVYKDVMWIAVIAFLVTAVYGLLLYIRRIVIAVYKAIRYREEATGIMAVSVGLTKMHLSVSIAFGTLIFILKEIM